MSSATDANNAKGIRTQDDLKRTKLTTEMQMIMIIEIYVISIDQCKTLRYTSNTFNAFLKSTLEYLSPEARLYCKHIHQVDQTTAKEPAHFYCWRGLG